MPELQEEITDFDVRENNGHQPPENLFNESFCINASRVYDSCADKDCLEDLPVYFPQNIQPKIDNACSVRLKNTEVITVYIDLDPVPFHRGFYTVEMTFFFEIIIDIFSAPAAPPETVRGLSIFNKKIVLYGSEGNVRIFNSDRKSRDGHSSPASKNLPKATVQVADPIGLEAKLKESCHFFAPCCQIPESICKKFGGSFMTSPVGKAVFVSIGLFTIVQIERNVQMLIPAYDFCIPEKECVESCNDPCEIFNRIDFPTNEFFPPDINKIEKENSIRD